MYYLLSSLSKDIFNIGKLGGTPRYDKFAFGKVHIALLLASALGVEPPNSREVGTYRDVGIGLHKFLSKTLFQSGEEGRLCPLHSLVPTKILDIPLPL